MGQNWKSAIKDIPMITFVHPQNRKIQAGVDYLVEEYRHVKKKIEEIKGSEIAEAELKASIDIYNAHRAAMREFTELTATHLNTVDSKSEAA